MGPRVIDMPDFVYHSTGPSEKEKKYDRQLRLWAAHGQQTLEDADLLLINTGSGTVGVEALKNLVLPGIGKFTIIDDLIVNPKDLGVNFFLDEDSLGNSRAECCVRLLEELNPDVKGESYSTLDVASLERLFAQRQYTFILYTFPIEPQILATVKTYSRKAKIPSISIHSAGFYSYFQVHFPETFPIVDTHPDPTAATDLRLLAPWDELKNFAEDLTEDLENMNAHEHAHVPYLLLLLYFLKKWKRTHGFFPSTYKEKTAFRDSVAAEARIDIPGGEENFDEAVSAVLRTVSVPTLSSSVREVFEYKPNEIESNVSFWIIADAIKKFFKKHQQLPLPGSLPDMKAQSTVYVKLQNIYKTKARQDAAEVLETVREHPNGKGIEMAEVENFCKNAAFIKLIRASEEVPARIKAISKQEFESDEMASMTKMPLSLFPIYLALRATSHVVFASSSDIIANIEKEILYAGQYQRVQQVAEEVARARGGELHNISALTGGMVAQEVIKIITKQYIPIDNTCIFDGVTSRTQVLRI